MVSKQLLKFAVVGIVSNLILFIAYVALTQIVHAPKTIMTVLYCVGVLIGFAGNKNWTFNYEGSVSESFKRYVYVYLMGYIINFSLLYVFVDKMQYPHELIQAIAIVVVSVSVFVMQKFFVFAPEKVERIK